MLSPHPRAPLEYWFFKVNAGRVALLVDWIARRKAQENVLRVSLHSPEQRGVWFEALPTGMMEGQKFISATCTAGQLGDVAWELAIEGTAERMAPDLFPARLLRLTDLTLESAPLATFTGWIQQGERCVELRQAPGLISHYWGRQLAPEWWWVSCSQFDRPDVAVECSVFRTGVWGIPVRLPMAYLYLRVGDSRRLLISPPAAAQVRGSPKKFEIHFRGLGTPPIILKAWGRDYGDLGDGIINTLVGDLEVWAGGRRLARAEWTAGLERRGGFH